MAVEPIVTAEWLNAHLADPSIRVVDMRGYVTTKQLEPGVEEAAYRGARDEYLSGHIPGAVYIDWTRDIVDHSDPVPAQIAGSEAFAEAMASRGIGDDTHVIAYDHMGGQFATRLWWALNYFGHAKVSVLDGGWNHWVEEDSPTAQGDVTPARAVFTPKPHPGLRVTAEQVRDRLKEAGVQIVDARDEGQYLGTRRRGPRGGHIPGAIHLPREKFFQPEGGFVSEEAARKTVEAAGLSPDRPVIAYCNGGVAATVVLFHLARLGFPALSNYDGSWNEWAYREDLPVESGPRKP